MADVRALLRQERAARQQPAHPQPARPQKQSPAPAAAPTSKKRKAADDVTEERKRTRTESAKGVPAGFFDGGDATEDADLDSIPNAPSQDVTPPPTTRPPPAPLNTGQEEDLDAFMKEMEEAPRQQSSFTAFASGAVIESAPMTVAEIAAQARQDQSEQRGAREQELEAEKEEAAFQLLDEFEEMDELEERVKKLRERREALRGQLVAAPQVEVVPSEPLVADDEEEDSDDEEWDDWRFRAA